RGTFPTAGLRLRVRDLQLPGKARDLNQDGKKEPWETLRLQEARLADGSRIDPKKRYRVGTIDYLARGGDDFAWPLKQIDPARIQLTAGPMVRDVVEAYFNYRQSTDKGLIPQDSAQRLQFTR